MARLIYNGQSVSFNGQMVSGKRPLLPLTTEWNLTSTAWK